MSNRLFQSVIQQMKGVVNRNIGVIDGNGIVTASSELSRIGEIRSDIHDELAFSQEMAVLGGVTYRYINAADKGGAIVFVEGGDAEADTFSRLLAITLANISNLSDEKYDKGSFIKNIMLDNILPSDIYIKSKELHFTSEEHHAVLVIKFSDKVDMMPYDIIQGMFPDKTHDYVINIGEQDIVLVKEVEPTADSQELEQLAASIVETLMTESYPKRVYIGISTIVDNLKDLARAYKEARIALEVGKVFDTERSVISYENLGIGRLIYQLPTSLCEAFLQEVFKRGSLESLESRDDDTQMKTVRAFFENNLNVSKTAESLYVHRNTLVYRLEKIRKLTGLDLREFDHAVTFKVALMVRKYLSTKPAKF
ncbi:MAG: helix-turn-helix domain-containing protein [Clostridia bacterium]|nr:helix-turn-helix domain-containing protein [Clostridia bacterium]